MLGLKVAVGVIFDVQKIKLFQNSRDIHRVERPFFLHLLRNTLLFVPVDGEVRVSELRLFGYIS